MRIRIKHVTALLACILLAGASSALAQQKGQWVPGQFGLNAGVIPDPGITYANLAMNYSAGQLNDSAGNKISGITSTYGFWSDENILDYVPNHKILGGYFMPYISINVPNGSLVADIAGTNLSADGDGISSRHPFLDVGKVNSTPVLNRRTPSPTCPVADGEDL